MVINGYKITDLSQINNCSEIYVPDTFVKQLDELFFNSYGEKVRQS